MRRVLNLLAPAQPVLLALAVLVLWPTLARAQSSTTTHEEHAKHQEHTPARAAGQPAQAHPPAPPPPAASEPRTPLPAFIPTLTDEDRKAAFPDVTGHAVHDRAINYFVLFDQLEWQSGGGASGVSWDNKTWVGRDRDRLWLRTEGETADGDVEHAEAHVLYGRAIARWWDLVAGVRQDFSPDPSRTWAAIGIQGLAPYWFEVEATAYVGTSGRTHLRLETEYELLLTNRLILQPLVELNIQGKADPDRGLGAGLSSADAGLRLRYEIRREVAPYVGVTWNRKFLGTADLARAAGERVGGARLTLGLRFWM